MKRTDKTHVQSPALNRVNEILRFFMVNTSGLVLVAERRPRFTNGDIREQSIDESANSESRLPTGYRIYFNVSL